MEYVAILIIIGVILFVESLIYKKIGLKELSYECKLDRNEASDGENIELVEQLNNMKFLPLPWIKTEITTSKWLDFAGSQSVVTDKSRFVPSFFMLKSYHKITRRWKVKCVKRGVFTIEKATLVASDPLGRTAMSLPIYVKSVITVKPAPADLESGIIDCNHLNGDYFVKRKLITDPFFTVGVKEYTPLDSMKKINWKSSAKEQKLMVKMNDYTASQSLTIIMNTHTRVDKLITANNDNYSEWCIKVCATYLLQGKMLDIPVSFMTNSSVDSDVKTPIYIEQGSGSNFIDSIFYTMAHMTLKITDDFDSYLNTVYDSVNSTDLVIVTATLTDDIINFATRKSYLGTNVKIIFVGGNLPDVNCQSCDIFLFDPSTQESIDIEEGVA